MSDYRIETKCVQAGYTPGNGEPRQIPIVQSTTFKYDTSEDMGKLFDLEAEGYFYSRLANPTCDAVAAKSRFFCADAGKAASQLAAEGLHPDVVMLDPPRKGCDEATLSAVVTMSPRRVVYVSCNPSTAARDAKWLEEHGYRAEKVQPVDLFPRTKHCETVCLLVLRNPVTHINIDVDVEEMVQDKRGLATYGQIKDYVLERSGLKVSSLYIAQVKQKHGIIERENYNKPKSEDVRQPQCPPDKERAITEALKHFGMI